VEYNDTLLTIAEIAVALAGFASLVSVIDRRRDDSSRAVDSLRLRMMLEVALRNAALALLPLPFLPLAPSDPIIWRIASGLYLVITAAHAFFRMGPGEAVLSTRWIRVSQQSLLSISLLACLSNVLGLGGSNAFSIYLASLLLGLTAAGLLFLAVAASTFHVERS